MAKPTDKRFSNKCDTVVFDGGNSYLKVISIGLNEGYHVQHALTLISPMEYERAKARYKANTSTFNFFKWRGQCYAFGKAAYSYSIVEAERKTGRAKFTRDYYGLLLVGCLLHLYNGAIPEYINVFGAHPPLDDGMKVPLYKSVKGKWKIETFNGTVSFEVLTVDSDDEITGGALHVRLNDNGHKDTKSLERFSAKGNTLVFDLGGGTADIALLDENFIPIDGTHKSVRIGINECITEFKQLFDDTYYHLMPNSADGLPIERVYDIFLDKDKTLRTWAKEPLNCTDLFVQATNPTLSRLYSAVNNLSGDIILRASKSLISGGAGGLLFVELSEVLFSDFADRGNLFLAESHRREAIFANPRGLAKEVKAIQAEERRQDKRG